MRIGVVGGGVVGLSCGVLLARAGHDVTLFEPSATRSAPSWNNAGHVAVEQVAPLASLASIRSAPARRFSAGGALHLPMRAWRTWLPFGTRLAAAARPARFRHGSAALRTLLLHAAPAWTRLAETLGECDLFRADGHLVVWESAASTAAGRRMWERADTGTATLRAVSDADAAMLERVAGAAFRGGGAVRFDGSGQIADPGRLAQALERTFAAAGGRIDRTPARLALTQGRARIVDREADLVLVAAGVASGAVLRPVGHHVPIVAERGYHIRAANDRWPVGAPPIVFEDRSMIVTRYAGMVQASSFVEVAAPDAPPDPRKWERLERHVAALNLPMAAPFARWMGARPTLPDYLPAIGRSRRASNLLYAFGHQHLGLTLAPITAELVAAMVQQASPAIDLAPFAIDRFAFGGRA